MIVDPWGIVLALAPDREAHIVADLDLDAQAASAASCRRSPTAARPPTAAARATALMAAAPARAAPPTSAAMILDAAVVAFARRGFHACRVSDIADEANVAYGLVYHYFRSKDEVLDTLFLERWNILLERHRRDRRRRTSRRARSCTRSRRSSSTPTATTPTS